MGDLPEKIRSGLTHRPTGCWEWTQAKTGAGYGEVRWEGAVRLVHRLVYELLVGPVPDGLELDHVKDRGCVSTLCCNPLHLEPVTHGENMRRSRRTHCRRGHELTPENSYIRPGKRWVRECRTCKRASNRAAVERRRAA